MCGDIIGGNHNPSEIYERDSAQRSREGLHRCEYHPRRHPNDSRPVASGTPQPTTRFRTGLEWCQQRAAHALARHEGVAARRFVPRRRHARCRSLRRGLPTFHARWSVARRRDSENLCRLNVWQGQMRSRLNEESPAVTHLSLINGCSV
jgi:hypothetical protein